MGWLEVVGQFFKLLNNVLPELFTYIKRKNAEAEADAKRKADAELAEQAAKRLAAEREAVCAEANLTAFKMSKDDVWIDRYDMVLKHLDANDPAAVIAMIKQTNVPSVNNVLFYSDKPNKDKALAIVEIMKAGIKPV